MGWFDAAQICLNGHVVNSAVKKYPEFNKAFCEICGQPTITKCPNCGAEIRGEYHSSVLSIGGSYYKAPAFCSNCGSPYPWTKSRIEAAKELADELDSISDEEKEILKKSIDDLIRDTPRTEVAAVKFKRIVAKTGAETANLFKEILIEIVSETVKKMIWGV